MIELNIFMYLPPYPFIIGNITCYFKWFLLGFFWSFIIRSVYLIKLNLELLIWFGHYRTWFVNSFFTWTYILFSLLYIPCFLYFLNRFLSVVNELSSSPLQIYWPYHHFIKVSNTVCMLYSLYIVIGQSTHCTLFAYYIHCENFFIVLIE